MTNCSIFRCSRKATRKGMCELHYRRTRIWGHPGPAAPQREYHGGYGTPEYIAWSNMLTRCYNPKRKDYPNYGGRGIRVCKRWKTSFANFLADMGKKPGSDYSIDRLDVDGNYTPENCHWATRKEQNNNSRHTVEYKIANNLPYWKNGVQHNV